MSPNDDDDYLRGRELFDNFVRGDAVIGLIGDVPATERLMLETLWSAASRGSAPAYRTLGEIYLAYVRDLGAYSGVDPSDAATRPWSTRALAVIEEGNAALEAALRSMFEAARLGDREAAMQFARLSRSSSSDNERIALGLLEQLVDPDPAELYQRALVHYWLGELEQSFATHVAAATAGNADAMFELYVLYAQGQGVAADPEASQAWLDRAAAAEHPRALYNLGAAFASGSGGEIDMAKAARYYERAAERGNGRAAATLALMILQHEIDGTNEQVVRWLDEAEELGFSTWEMLEAAGLDDPREA